MKKLLTVSIALVLVLSLVSCGVNNNQVQNALQGKWIAEWKLGQLELNHYYIFKGDTFTGGGRAAFGDTTKEAGKYEITDSEIHLIDDSGGNTLEYSYDENSETITLWWSKGNNIQFHKVD